MHRRIEPRLVHAQIELHCIKPFAVFVLALLLNGGIVEVFNGQLV